ncbi:hypothetical protein BVRB_2g046620 [Beta vulgaris subsp. vulgaris]|nr:hypothetical protein BVRB_2g046620 [Beta vulgaris subsp. vulgaris]
MNCRVETFGKVVKGFDERKRKLVTEMGFGGLLFLSGKSLPRTFYYWLCTRVDVNNKVLLMLDGLEFPLSKTRVYWVLGIPAGPKTVPLYGDDADEGGDEVMRFLDVYGYTSRSGVRGIKASVIKQNVEGEISSDAEFKKAFLMMTLNDLICPMTCQRMSVSLLYAVVVAERPHEYDWCSLLLDHLIIAIGGFAKRFCRDGFAKGCGRCTMFLAILYLDRLRRPPLMWGRFSKDTGMVYCRCEQGEEGRFAGTWRLRQARGVYILNLYCLLGYPCV